MKRAAAAAVVLLVAGIACSKGTGQATPNPASAAPSSTATTVAVSFGQIAYRVSTQPNAARCALLAETDAQHERGLMSRTDLGGFDGMLFVFPSPTTVTFWMKDTVLPLSIAYFDASGRFVSSADMAPCLGRGSNCPEYPATGPYTFAIEVPRGGLGALGIGPGAVLTSGGACA